MRRSSWRTCSTGCRRAMGGCGWTTGALKPSCDPGRLGVAVFVSGFMGPCLRLLSLMLLDARGGLRVTGEGGFAYVRYTTTESRSRKNERELGRKHKWRGKSKSNCESRMPGNFERR